MKQRIRVTGIIRRGDEILLLKRAVGKSERLPNYELLVGKIVFGEQPEEAMARLVYDYIGVRTEEVRLRDAITFTSLVGASELANLYIVYEVDIKDESVKITTERYSTYKWVKIDDMGALVLDEASLTILEITNGHKGNVVKNIGYRGEKIIAEVYVDGGSRGNPGPSGVGYYILGANGEVLKRGGEFLGFATSRVAEYYGLKEGIEQAVEMGIKSVRFMSDSLMLVNQMNGVYKVKNSDLIQIYDDIWKLLVNVDSYRFGYIRREQNREADREVNRVSDVY